MIGVILICDAITLKLRHKSLINEIIKSKENVISFTILSVVSVFILELVAHWLGKLWIYPYWGYITYFLFLIPGFFVYCLLICESYLATKALFDYFHKGKKHVKKRFRWEHTLFPALGLIGLFLLIVSVVWIYQDYSKQGTALIEAEDLYSKTSTYVIPFGSILLIFLGLWFVLEYAEYRIKENSLIKDIVHSYPTPLISILVCSFVLAVFMESQNLIYNLWAYINWPFEGITFMGLPVTMFLAWPFHYVAFLSLFRVFSRKESSEVWTGDLIK